MGSRITIDHPSVQQVTARSEQLGVMMPDGTVLWADHRMGDARHTIDWLGRVYTISTEHQFANFVVDWKARIASFNAAVELEPYVVSRQILVVIDEAQAVRH